MGGRQELVTQGLLNHCSPVPRGRESAPSWSCGSRVPGHPFSLVALQPAPSQRRGGGERRAVVSPEQAEEDRLAPPQACEEWLDSASVLPKTVPQDRRPCLALVRAL